MEYSIKCPACRMTDLELMSGESAYVCAGCGLDFTVEYKQKASTIIERYWKKTLLAAIILL